jgi:hypothetical protein
MPGSRFLLHLGISEQDAQPGATTADAKRADSGNLALD